MRAILLALLLPLAGCVDVGDAGDEGEAPSGPDGDASARTCEPSEETFVDWAAPEPPADPTTSVDFDVRAGTRSLDIQWTPPTAAVRGYSAVVVGPDGGEVFVERFDEGVASGGSSVGLGGQERSVNAREPPLVGTYTFTFQTDGQVQGAAMRIAAAGCW